MKILLHICCAPCAVYPVEILRGAGIETMGFFYRHNIHPYTECLRRQETLNDYADQVDLRVIYQKSYDMEGFLRNVVFRETERCTYCYHDRLRSTAKMARSGKFDGFSTTLLYSKFQNHEQIRSMGQAVARAVGVPFYYRDFRDGWKRGIETSKRMNLYRQQYCGCIYSEKERYLKKQRPHVS
jgi:epoxyqueuosine reductase